jgi:hypothetical protein
MNTFDGGVGSGGIVGLRLDLPAHMPLQPSAEYPRLTSYFFYQSGTSVGTSFLFTAIHKICLQM